MDAPGEVSDWHLAFGIWPLPPRAASTKVQGPNAKCQMLTAASLLRLEHCRPLLYVRCQAFFRVFTLEQYLLVLALDRQRRLHGNLPASLYRALDPPHSLRR